MPTWRGACHRLRRRDKVIAGEQPGQEIIEELLIGDLPGLGLGLSELLVCVDEQDLAQLVTRDLTVGRRLDRAQGIEYGGDRGEVHRHDAVDLGVVATHPGSRHFATSEGE